MKILILFALLSTAISQSVMAGQLKFISPNRLPKLDSRTALIIVDVQHDFLPGGALGVDRGNEIVPVLKRYAQEMTKAGGLVIATQDWHPAGHVSFKSSGRGGIWPVHCVEKSAGAEVIPDLMSEVSPSKPGGEEKMVFRKGYDPDRDAYSGFDGTDLARELKARGIRKVLVGGLTTDYCVRATVLDAIKAGFKAYLLVDGSRGVESKPGDIDRALLDMQRAGGILVREKPRQ